MSSPLPQREKQTQNRLKFQQEIPAVDESAIPPMPIHIRILCLTLNGLLMQ
jgi:hypothetical protein